MKRQHTKNIVRYKAHQLPVDTKTDWKRVDAMTDKELEENALADTDSLLADEKFWRVAKLVMPTDAAKERITIRIDTDVLGWLKQQGKGYQSKINSILRAFMKTDQKHHHVHSSHKHAHR